MTYKHYRKLKHDGELYSVKVSPILDRYQEVVEVKNSQLELRCKAIIDHIKSKIHVSYPDGRKSILDYYEVPSDPVELVKQIINRY